MVPRLFRHWLPVRGVMRVTHARDMVRYTDCILNGTMYGKQTYGAVRLRVHLHRYVFGTHNGAVHLLLRRGRLCRSHVTYRTSTVRSSNSLSTVVASTLHALHLTHVRFRLVTPTSANGAVARHTTITSDTAPSFASHSLAIATRFRFVW